MAVTEREVVEKLNALFPDHVIYPQTYIKRGGTLTMIVRKLAKEADVSSVQWLSAKGFTWKEVGYIEPDMKRHQVDPPVLSGSPDDAFTLAHYVLSAYPLAGEYLLTEEESKLLYQSAYDTVQKILGGSGAITKRDNVVLVVATIDLLRGWSYDLGDEESAGAFWNYIYLQYGFNPEKSEEAQRRLYKHFRDAIKFTTEHYSRFFATEGHKYYTTLLLHAIAPTQSIEAFFNILFSFYVKNLDFQYVPEDISYKTFVTGMQARWDPSRKNEQTVQLRSDQVFSGLHALLTQRPGYMAILADNTVKKMDALLRGEGRSALDEERNYWDRLLLNWYKKKSSTERVRIQGERRQHKTEYVATTVDRIYVQFAYSNNLVGLTVPKIRLPKVGEQRPVLRIFQDGACIHEQEMSVIGDALSLTTRSLFVALQNTDYDFGIAPAVRATITYMGEQLYDSRDKLERPYVIFDSTGSDRIPKSGTAFLFASDSDVVNVYGDEGFYRLNHPGQLYNINLDEVSAVSVNGAEIFADETTTSHIRHHSSIRKVQGLRSTNLGKTVDVYPDEFDLSIRLPEEDNSIRYQVSVDGERRTPHSVQLTGNEMTIPSAKDEGAVHTVRIIDVETDTVKYEYNYMILKGAKMVFNKPLFHAGVDQVEGKLSWGDLDAEINEPLLEGASSISFVVPGTSYQFEADVPAMHCTLLGENAFQAQKRVWHKDIPAGEVVEIRVPTGWTGHLMLGVQEVPATEGKTLKCELGNMLRAHTYEVDEMDLWISLKSETGAIEHHKLTEIIFQPRFQNSPLEFADGSLLWQAQDNFLGELGTQFQVELTQKDGTTLSFNATTDDAVLMDAADLPKGKYPVKVSSVKKSVFSAGVEKVLFEGEIPNGDPNEFQFDGMEIHIGDALVWDYDSETLRKWRMRENCGVVCNLTYLGVSTASGEIAAVPNYQGIMYFEDQMGVRHPFNSRESEEYELVNPVLIWIINDNLLILRCVTEDTVYIDKKFSSIVNRSPDVNIPRQEQSARLENPDYFEFKVKEVRRRV